MIRQPLSLSTPPPMPQNASETAEKKIETRNFETQPPVAEPEVWAGKWGRLTTVAWCEASTLSSPGRRVAECFRRRYAEIWGTPFHDLLADGCGVVKAVMKRDRRRTLVLAGGVCFPLDASRDIVGLLEGRYRSSREYLAMGEWSGGDMERDFLVLNGDGGLDLLDILCDGADFDWRHVAKMLEYLWRNSRELNKLIVKLPHRALADAGLAGGQDCGSGCNAKEIRGRLLARAGGGSGPYGVCVLP